MLFLASIPKSYSTFLTDESSSEALKFLSEFGQGVQLRKVDTAPLNLAETSTTLYCISDASGSLTFQVVHPPKKSSLSSQDAFLLDHSAGTPHPTIFVWIGKAASLAESRMAIQYAQRFLYDKKARITSNRVQVTIPIVKMLEGHETPSFLEII